MENAKKIKIELSWMSVIKVFTVAIALYLLYLVIDILAILFFVFIFVAALNPLVQKMQKRMPRLLAVLILFILIIAVIALSSTLLFQPLVSQVNNLGQSISQNSDRLLPIVNQYINFDLQSGQDLLRELAGGLQSFSGAISNISSNVVNTALGIFGGLFMVLTVFVLSFYLLLEERAAKFFIDNIISEKYRAQFLKVTHKILDKMGAWVGGQVLIMVFIAVIYYVTLLILGVQSPLPLAIWAGLMEVIPYVGPFVGGLPAVVVALISGTPLQALLVIVAMVVIQQIEGNILIPKVMQKAVGLSPVVVMVAMLIGGKLLGIIGVLISIPLAAIVAVLIAEWPDIAKTLRS